jgi:hypothetical protein
MLTTAALFAFLFQAGGQPTPHAGWPAGPCLRCVEDSISATGVSLRQAQYEQQDFSRRFNGLANAITDFSNTYNSRGVIDVKKVKAIQKAWRELEKSDWFNPKRESRVH